jgi:hypothetical protein
MYQQPSDVLIMRNPRAIIFNFTERVFPDLMTFFHRKGYEVLVFTKDVACPLHVHDRQEQKTCSLPVPCSDIMVGIQDIAQTTDFDLFTRQSQQECKVALRNKVIITHSVADGPLNNIKDHSMTVFGNPLDFNALEAWVKDCEARMNLSQRLAAMRRANRHVDNRQVLYLLSGEDAAITAKAVNVSACGMCLKIQIPINSGRKLRIASQGQSETEDGRVQWVKKLEDGWYLIGVTFCV